MAKIDIYARRVRLRILRNCDRRRNNSQNVEGVPDIPMFRKITSGFVHELPENTLAMWTETVTYSSSGRHQQGALES